MEFGSDGFSSDVIPIPPAPPGMLDTNEVIQRLTDKYGMLGDLSLAIVDADKFCLKDETSQHPQLYREADLDKIALALAKGGGVWTATQTSEQLAEAIRAKGINDDWDESIGYKRRGKTQDPVQFGENEFYLEPLNPEDRRRREVHPRPELATKKDIKAIIPKSRPAAPTATDPKRVNDDWDKQTGINRQKK
jgi:hypothetical protein